jgi:hypothetical protein
MMFKALVDEGVFDPKKVKVYRNLHKGCYSIQYKGRVVAHADEVLIREPVFRVQPAGRKRVLRTKKKNVHAFVVGELISFVPTGRGSFGSDGRGSKVKMHQPPIQWSPLKPKTDQILVGYHWFKAKYNPYKLGSFYVESAATARPLVAIKSAEWVRLDTDGTMYVNSPEAKEEIEEWNNYAPISPF